MGRRGLCAILQANTFFDKDLDKLSASIRAQARHAHQVSRAQVVLVCGRMATVEPVKSWPTSHLATCRRPAAVADVLPPLASASPLPSEVQATPGVDDDSSHTRLVKTGRARDGGAAEQASARGMARQTYDPQGGPGRVPSQPHRARLRPQHPRRAATRAGHTHAAGRLCVLPGHDMGAWAE